MTIELKDDKPNAVRSLLRYLYTLEYEELGNLHMDWRHHLRVAEAANKYGVEELEHLAWASFRASVEAEYNIHTVLAVLRELPHWNYGGEAMDDIVEHLRDKHFEKLLGEQEFRDDMEATRA